MITITDTMRQAMLGAAGPTANAGSVIIYAGAVPANASAALGGATQLVAITLANPAYAGSASGDGSRALQGVPRSGTAGASGTATFARLVASGGGVLAQGGVALTGAGTADTLVTLSSLTITVSDIVSITSGSITV